LFTQRPVSVVGVVLCVLRGLEFPQSRNLAPIFDVHGRIRWIEGIRPGHRSRFVLSLSRDSSKCAGSRWL